MNSREPKTEATRDDKPDRSEPRGVLDTIVHKLARFFNGIHWAMGITILPATATAREERSFVLMWVGIIVFMIVFFAVFVYILGSI